MSRILLTGAGGFVGHHVLEHLMAATAYSVAATDSFRHRGKTDRISQVLAGKPQWQQRTEVITHDLAAPFSPQMIAQLGPVGTIIAMASESHVDRSIEEPVPFVKNNVDVILNTLELARVVKPTAVVVISTDEVYGPERDDVPHKEWAPILPSNPYSASKAAQEAIAISYWRTYGVPVVIVNCMNLIGERQDKEKFLPMLIHKISTGQKVPVHGRPDDIGTRHYLHARNLASGICFILQHLPPRVYPAHLPPGSYNASMLDFRAADRPDRYNIVGPDRIDNLLLANMVAGILGRDLDYELVDFHSARPGHDPHYGLDPAKLSACGWKPPVEFSESLRRTVQWTVQHPDWLL